jgi:hypothetical protein
VGLVVGLATFPGGRAARADDTPLPDDRRVLLENALRRELVKALAHFEAKGEESKDVRMSQTLLHGIKVEVDVPLKVEAKVRFPNPEHTLLLKVLSLAARDEKTLVGRVSASARVEGRLKGTVEPATATVEFDAMAVVERVDFQVAWDVEPGTGALVYRPRATDLKTAVKEVHLHDDVAKAFPMVNDIAEKAATTWLEQSRDRLLGLINGALDRAFRDGKLRVSPQELMKPSTAGAGGTSK